MIRSGSPLAAAVAMAMAMSAPSAAPAQGPEAVQQQVDEIVITGRRSGVPMWTVRGEATTLVLVGAIQGVSKATKWDPQALTEALRRADRVMFPQAHVFTVGSPFKLIGWFAKWKAMGSLPKGQRLGDFLDPEALRRLAALQARGMAPRDFESRHPLHLANDLRERASGDIGDGRSAGDYVSKAVRKHKLTLVPIGRSKAKPLVKDLFASTPHEHVPCLVDAIAAAEAGPAAVQARSDAWAARRVPEVLASPADKVFSSCWPAGAVGAEPGELLAEMQQLLREPQLTLAVLGLRALAEPGGVLDGLAAAGFDVQGPAWK